MKLILLSGGSGKRLWPLSNDSRSKQFIRVLENEQGKKESMVQRVWNQLGQAGLQDSAIIATSKGQIDMIYSQLSPHVPVVLEPERRDTFPAVALATCYLASVQNVTDDEVIIVLPVDPFVENEFFTRLKVLAAELEASKAQLALMGVKPTIPSVKFGYIVPGERGSSESLPVSHFREKPCEEQARELIREGALWNCGVFAFKAGYLLSMLRQKGLPTDYKEVLANYQRLPKISFDYEVVEKAENIICLEYQGCWKDLGTWNTLTEEVQAPVVGKGIISKDSKNTHLINELDIPVTVLGLSNVVVAVSPDGILVADKNASPRVKDMVSHFEQRPMYEERRWGWYRVLDYTQVGDSAEVLTKRIGVAAGKNLSYQVHRKRNEVWTIIKGQGEFALNDRIFPVHAGDVLQIPVGARHGIKALSDLEFIETQTGSDLVEEDIERIYLSWEEVQAHCTAKKPALDEIAAAVHNDK